MCIIKRGLIRSIADAYDCQRISIDTLPSTRLPGTTRCYAFRQIVLACCINHLRQAEKNPIFPAVFAEKLVEDLTGVPGGAMLYNVKGQIKFIS